MLFFLAVLPPCSHLGIVFSLFTDEEIQTIRDVTYHDVVVAVTSAEATDIQKNAFFWRDGNKTTHMTQLCLLI